MKRDARISGKSATEVKERAECKKTAINGKSSSEKYQRLYFFLFFVGEQGQRMNERKGESGRDEEQEVRFVSTTEFTG